MMMQIRPLMNNLPKLVDTYKNVCGNLNPFPGDIAYDYTSADFHNYMLCFHSELPVMNDLQKLQQQIQLVFLENGYKYAMMYKSLQYGQSQENPFTAQMHYTETTTRTGHDDLTKTGSETSTRTGNVADSGTDSTANGGTVTDSTKTYDSGTLHDVNQSTTSATGSITHGKTTTYNNVADAKTYTGRKDETAYNSTFTKTVSGYKTTPAEMMADYMDFVRQNNLFAEIMRDVVQAISCIVYIPILPPENPAEEDE